MFSLLATSDGPKLSFFNGKMKVINDNVISQVPTSSIFKSEDSRTVVFFEGAVITEYKSVNYMVKSRESSKLNGQHDLKDYIYIKNFVGGKIFDGEIITSIRFVNVSDYLIFTESDSVYLKTEDLHARDVYVNIYNSIVQNTPIERSRKRGFNVFKIDCNCPIDDIIDVTYEINPYSPFPTIFMFKNSEYVRVCSIDGRSQKQTFKYSQNDSELLSNTIEIGKGNSKKIKSAIF